MIPFEVAIGFQPRTPLDMLVYEQPGHSLSPVAYKFAKTRQDLLDEAWDSLEMASRRMTKYVDKGRRPLEFEEGGEGSVEANSSNMEENPK